MEYCKPSKDSNSEKLISALITWFENSILIVCSSIWVDADVGFNMWFFID